MSKVELFNLKQPFKLTTATIVALITGMSICFGVSAEAKDKGKGSGGGSREKIISREGRSKASNSKTKIDFDDAEIGGARKTPMASMLTNGKAKKDYDLVPIRTDWKPEMVQSASSLDAGRMK